MMRRMKLRVGEFFIGAFLGLLFVLSFLSDKSAIVKSFSSPFHLPFSFSVIQNRFVFPTLASRPTLQPLKIKPIRTPTPTKIPQVTSTPTVTPSPTPTSTPSVVPSLTPFPSATPTATPSLTPTNSLTPTLIPTSSPTPTITPTPTLTQRLIAYFRIEEGSGKSINDSSGNGLNLVLDGTNIVSWSGKIPNTTNADNFSLSFDGGGYGRLSTTSAMQAFDFPLGFTLEAWINVAQGFIASDSAIVGKWFNNQGWRMGYTGSKVINIINNSKLISGPNLNDGFWHHIAMTWNGNTQITYIDGIKTGFISNTQIPQSIDKEFFLASFNPPTANFTGFVDEVKIYNYARLQSEIITDGGIIPIPTSTPTLTPTPVLISLTPTLTPVPTAAPFCGNNQCCRNQWCGASSSTSGGVFCGTNERCVFDVNWQCNFDSSCR